MAAIPLPKLTPAEWTEVKEYAASLSGYDQDTSPIKGKKTVSVLQTIDKAIESGDYSDARDTLEVLMRREAFNALVGIEGKNRRKAKRAAGLAS